MSRIKDPKLLAEVSKSVCCVDGCNRQAQAAHIKSKGSGGDDTAENVSPLCWKHHIAEQHIIGWKAFKERHPEVKSWAELRKQTHVCWGCVYNGMQDLGYLGCVNAFKIGMYECQGYRVEV